MQNLFKNKKQLKKSKKKFVIKKKLYILKIKKSKNQKQINFLKKNDFNNNIKLALNQWDLANIMISKNNH